MKMYVLVQTKPIYDLSLHICLTYIQQIFQMVKIYRQPFVYTPELIYKKNI